MSSRLGVYFAPGHSRPTDLEYIKRLQPAMVRILDPDVAEVAAVHSAAPEAIIALRFWSIDDQNFTAQRSMWAAPVSFAEHYVRDTMARVEMIERQAADRGLSIPPRKRLAVNLVNEPYIWGSQDERRDRRASLDRYSQKALELFRPHGVGVLVGCINTGQPDEWPVPDWSWFAGTLAALRSHPQAWLELHEYWQPEGPSAVWTDGEGRQREDATALAWRHKRSVAALAGVRIVIGECGVDGVLFGRNARINTGWRAYMSPESYAAQLVEYVNGCSSQVEAVLPFLTDYRANANDTRWQSFDTEPAHSAILNRLHQVRDFPPAPEPAKPDDNWERSIAFVLRWEGGWSDNPADPGGATMRGITLNTYTNWRRAHGQPAPTKDDLRALTVDEAKRIYRAWYWEESGADSLPWPLCLVHFDAAVNSGPWRAGQLLRGSGGDFDQYLANRIDWYASLIKLWPDFGRAWTRRCADVLRVGRKA